MNIKSGISILLIVALCFSLGLPAFAIDTHKAEQVGSIKSVTIDVETLSINSSERKEYVKFGENMASAIRASDAKSIDETVKTFCCSHSNPVFDNIQEIIVDNSLQDRPLYLKTPQNFVETYEMTYVIDEKRILTITPTYIVIEVLTTDDSSPKGLSTQASTSSKSGTSSKTYYSILGTKVFSLSVECTFYYNGSKAWYKSGFDYYYTKGTLSVWQVSNWRGWKETSGTSYKAYCSGNFHWGIEYEGNGLVIQDYYCKNTLTCNKNGTISTSATMS